jgi:predicted nucleotidyltransferase component of viral defense system
MIQLDLIRGYFPEHIRHNRLFDTYMLKEYLQLLILDYLSNTPYMKKMTFIGGTCLRLIKGIDRFSEDLDFDCDDITLEEFNQMTDGILLMLRRNGIMAETRDRENARLTAFRRSIFFPGMLFSLGLTGHRTERLLIKIEAQDQGVQYVAETANIKGCGFYFPVRVPPDGVLCAMKIAAMLARAKGRDFYDVIFLLGLTKPDYNFLNERCGIGNMIELKTAISDLLRHTSLERKMKDFEHLLIIPSNNKKILHFDQFIEGYLRK